MAVRSKKIAWLQKIIELLTDPSYLASLAKHPAPEINQQQKHMSNIVGSTMCCNQLAIPDVNLLQTIQIELDYYVEELEREEFFWKLQEEYEKAKQAFLDAIAATADIQEKKALLANMKEFYEERLQELEKKLSEQFKKREELQEMITLLKSRILQFEEKIILLNTESYEISIKMLSPASTDTSTQFTLSDKSGKSFSFEVRDEAIKQRANETIMLQESRGEKISVHSILTAVRDAIAIETKHQMKASQEKNIHDVADTVIEQPNYQENQQRIMDRIVDKKVLAKITDNNQLQDVYGDKIIRLKEDQAECTRKLAVVEKRIDIIQQEIKEVREEKKENSHKVSYLSDPDVPDSENPDSSSSPRMGRK